MTFDGMEFEGRVTGTKGSLLTADLIGATLGAWCEIQCATPLKAKIVNFHESEVLLAPLGDIVGLSSLSKVRTSNKTPAVTVGNFLIGNSVNALGEPIQNINYKDYQKVQVPLYRTPPHFLDRAPITKQLETGIKVIDGITPIGVGQRMGVIAQAGVGKSTLLSQIAKRADVDIIVIGLIGERGREVQEFTELFLGSDARKRCILVISTSDDPPILRATAPYTATAIAEFFRDQGNKVLLVLDSLTRTARALRDVGLSIGEIPVRHGYTPSVYAELPKLIERAGSTHKGSITALYSLLGSEDHDDPLSEEVKSLLDGHIILSSSVAQQGIRPSVDVLRSLSRLSGKLLPEEVQSAANTMIRLHQRVVRDRDLVTFGGIPDEELKIALDIENEFSKFRNQSLEKYYDKSETFKLLVDISKLAYNSTGKMQ